MTNQDYTVAGTYNWTVPAGVTSVDVMLIGGGGGGGSQTVTGSSGGGGGGSRIVIRTAVTPGNVHSLRVGFGGEADSTGQGSSFAAASGGSTMAVTNGGNAGTGNGGAGGATALIGTINSGSYLSGDNGPAGANGVAGSYGGSGGASVLTTTPTGNQTTSNASGINGSVAGAGAGGSGVRRTSGTVFGGVGAAGLVRLTYSAADTTAPTAPGQPSLSNQAETSVTLTWTAATDAVGVTNYQVFKDGVQYGSDLGNVLTTGVTGLTPGTQYSFTVKAKDAAGNVSSASTARTYTPADATAPSAPGQPSLSNQAETSVTLTWTASTDNVGVTGYDIYKDGSLYSSLGNVLTGNVTGLTPGTQYSFTIKAKDVAGNTSAASTARTYTPTDSTAPSAPGQPSLSNQAETSVTLTWTAASDSVGVTAYQIFKDGSLYSTLGNVLTGSVTSLIPGTQYSFTIKAKDAAGNTSAASTARTYTPTDVSAPSAPGRPSLSNQDETSVTLTWTAATDNVGVTAYKVYGAPGGTITLGNVLTTTVTGLSVGTQYSFTVTAKDAAGNESTASTARTYTPTDVTAPSVPGQPSLSNQTETSVTLTWSASSDSVGVTGYTVYGAPGGAITLGNVLTTNVTGLTVGTQYSFTVTAKDAAGNESSASTARTFTPLDVTPPSDPTNVQISANSNMVTVTWSGSGDSSLYEIFRNNVSVGTAALTTFSQVVPDGTHTFTVRARDTAGNWSGRTSSATISIDVTPPSVPSNVQAVLGDKSVVLTWDMNQDAAIYEILRDGVVIASRTTGTFHESFAAYGTHVYGVRARDTTGNWSEASTDLPVVLKDLGSGLFRAPLDEQSVIRESDDPVDAIRRFYRSDADEFGGAHI